MRCARCGRTLLRSGVAVQVGGVNAPIVIAGPRCAELMRYGDGGRPRRARLFTSHPIRQRTTGQADMFEVAAC